MEFVLRSSLRISFLFAILRAALLQSQQKSNHLSINTRDEKFVGENHHVDGFRTFYYRKKPKKGRDCRKYRRLRSCNSANDPSQSVLPARPSNAPARISAPGSAYCGLTKLVKRASFLLNG